MKPIIFSTPMVQAILDGKKTQTRRVIKIDDAPENWKISIAGTSIVRTEPYDVKLPRYAAGDILWVRETWTILQTKYFYRADMENPTGHYRTKWRPSIHMPREAARIFLEVKNVRVERLQDITEEDAKAEGVICWQGQKRWTARSAFMDLWDRINGKKNPWESNPWVWVCEFEKINKE